MKLKKIKIGGIDYTVKVTKNLLTGNVVLDGLLENKTTTISVDEELNAQSRMQAVFHETFHAIFTQIGQQTMDESTVDALAFSWMQVLRDNPGLIEEFKACWTNQDK
jgi:hypothetical protein